MSYTFITCFLQLTKTSVRENIDKWRNIGASDTILNWIKFGVDIPFHTTPEHLQLKNQVLSAKHYAFVTEEIHRPHNQGAIIKCNTEKPLYIAYYLRAKEKQQIEISSRFA